MAGYEDHTALMGNWTHSINDDTSGSQNKSRQVFADLGDANQGDQAQASVVCDEAFTSKAMDEPQINGRGSLLDRMAARAGFNAPRLNTESIRTSDFSNSPEVRSPYLTIPPGLSPTTLLDSPVFLSNSMVLPSPTTGTYPFSYGGDGFNSMLMIEDLEKVKDNAYEDVNSTSFAFKPLAESGSALNFNVGNNMNPTSFSPLYFPGVGASVHPETSFVCQSMEPPQVHSQNNYALFQPANITKSCLANNGGVNLSSGQVCVAEDSPSIDEQHVDDVDPNAAGSPSEDGYNWRKYGQKQVKGSEYPRSYYKCTYPNCTVKKKVERSEEGHITEIIYKGAHNHPKSPSSRKSTMGCLNGQGDIQHDCEHHGTGANDVFSWSRQGNLEASPLGQDYCAVASSLQAQTSQLELGDGVDGSSTFSNDEEDDDGATHGSTSLGYDGEGDELESKRRRIETYPSDLSGATRAIREPRVVVQTTSEVDILDDGYRWRKYGQKVVKGNPNPRSYYKCTSPGCNVRKHVERASHDLKSVITTYEGKHNHDVPAARNSSHLNSTSLPPQQATTPASSSLVHRAQPSQTQSSASRFERPMLGPFSRPHLGPGPGPGFGFGVNQAGLASLAMAGLGPNPGRLPMLPVHSYFGNPAVSMNNNNMGFLLPKGEPKMEPVTDSGLSSSSASSVYQQLMSRLPLGPQM